MASPTRFLSGYTQDNSWQPLGHMGMEDPFFYAMYEDDFLHYNGGDYTTTNAGGTIAATASNGIGGRILFTTGAVAGNFCEIQLSTAGFQYTAGKKLFYLTRIRTNDVTNNAIIAGLCNTTVTPFTAIADGIYFSKAAGSTNLVLTVVTGSTTIGSATITGALANNTDIDFGFYIDRSGNIKAFYGSSLVGYKRPNTANLGPDVGILNSALTGTLTAAQLNPTLAVSNGTAAAAVTMVADFQLAAMER